VNEGSITKFTKILCHQNLELYGIDSLTNYSTNKVAKIIVRHKIVSVRAEAYSHQLLKS